MLPASNRGAGQNIGFPDVCLTPAPPAPPVPVPYPNIGMNAQALGFSPIVKVSMVNALNLGSTIAMTSGDEAGAAHPTIKGQGKWTMGNPIVNIDRLPAIHLTCPSTGNMMNNGLGLAAVPSAVNVTYCYAGGSPSAVGTADLETLAAAMRSPSVRAERLPGGVALLEIGVFAPGLATDVFRALRELEGDLVGDLVALVIDLRGCPGGDLDAAFALAESLLPAGAVIAQLIEDGDEARTVVARSISMGPQAAPNQSISMGPQAAPNPGAPSAAGNATCALPARIADRSPHRLRRRGLRRRHEGQPPRPPRRRAQLRQARSAAHRHRPRAAAPAPSPTSLPGPCQARQRPMERAWLPTSSYCLRSIRQRPARGSRQRGPCRSLELRITFGVLRAPP